MPKVRQTPDGVADGVVFAAPVIMACREQECLAPAPHYDRMIPYCGLFRQQDGTLHAGKLHEFRISNLEIRYR